MTPCIGLRRLLTAAHEKISDRGQTRLRGPLDAGDPHGEVRTAWHATKPSEASTGSTVQSSLSNTPPTRRRPRRPLMPTRDQQAGSYHRPLVCPGHQLAHLEGNQRTHRSSQQPHQTDQTSSLRVPELRELPNPALLYAGKPNWNLLATVTPHQNSMSQISSPVVGPSVASMSARDVIRRGESLHLIEVRRGSVGSVPAGS